MVRRAVVGAAVVLAATASFAHEWAIQDYIREKADLEWEDFTATCVDGTGAGIDKAKYAFDGVIDTSVAPEWRSQVQSGVEASVIVKIPETVEEVPRLKRYRIYGVLPATGYSYTWQLYPKNFKLQGRNGNMDEWTDIDVRTGVSFAQNEYASSISANVNTYARDFTIETPVAYRQYRFWVSEVQQIQSGHAIAVQELSLVVEDDETTPARTYCVTQAGTDDGEGTWASPLSLQAALNRATARDEIHVKEGTFDLSSGTSLVAPHACAIRGGYAGTEGATDEPAGASRTTFDLGGVTPSGLEITETGPLGYLIENIAFTNGLYHGVNASTAGLVGRVRNCAFLRNGWEAGAMLLKGRGCWVAGVRGSPLTFEGCEFRGNVLSAAKNGQYDSNAGSGLYASWIELSLTNCLFYGNGQRADINSQTYGRDCSPGGALYVSNGRVVAKGCGFYGNRNTLNGGGSGTGNCDGSIVHIYNGRDGSKFENCRFVGNSYAPWGGTGISGTLVIYTANAATEVRIDKCTFAYNLHGVCAGVTVFQGKAVVRNSIFYGNLVNEPAAKGADVYCAASTGSADIDYTLFKENTSVYVSAGSGTVTMGAHNVYGDPLFATDLETVKALITGTKKAHPYAMHPFYYKYNPATDFEAFDVHLKSGAGRWTPSGYVTTDEGLLSPAIDAGDNSAFSNEPAPNGGIVNLGCYGNTDQASKSSAAVPVIDSVEVTMTADATRPKVAGALKDDTNPYSVNVTLYYGYEQGTDDGSSGWTWSEPLAGGVGPGTAFGKDFCRYLETGRTLYWRVVVTKGESAQTSEGGSLVVTGTMPALWGKGLGENYIHVWAGGQGSNGGTDWLDACTSIDQAIALVTDTRKDIVIAGTVPCRLAEPFFPKPVNVWGGFDPSMTDFAERDPAAYPSVLDGGAAYGCFAAANSTGCTYVRDVTFTRSMMSAFKKINAGDLWLENCRFLNCGTYYLGANPGRALTVSATSAATVMITNCSFEGNCSLNSSADTASSSGCAIYATAAKRIFVDNTLFATNGFPWKKAAAAVPGRDGTVGWTVHASGAPVTMRNCKFLGNRTTGNGSKQGAVVYLGGMGTGAPCAFTNCIFAGNALHPNGDTTCGSGLIYVSQAANATLVDFYACTFSYNLYRESYAPIFTLDKGAVRVRNSILAENVTGSARGQANIVYFLSANATLNLDWCLIGPTTENTLPDAAPAANAGQATIGPNVIRDKYARFGTKERDFLAQVTGTKQSPLETFFADDEQSYRAVFAKGFDPTTLNLHLAGGRYVDETTGEVRSICGTSPAINAGDPASDWSREPPYNGHRIDLGSYGNTPWTTYPIGLLLFVR